MKIVIGLIAGNFIWAFVSTTFFSGSSTYSAAFEHSYFQLIAIGVFYYVHVRPQFAMIDDHVKDLKAVILKVMPLSEIPPLETKPVTDHAKIHACPECGSKDLSMTGHVLSCQNCTWWIEV